MANILNSYSVLRLNANYQRLGWATPKQAFCMMAGGVDNEPPALALDVHYKYDEYQVPITDGGMEYFDRFDWEYWMILQPRQGDLDKVIHTSKRIIRVPTIIVCQNFHTMPKKEQRPTPQAIRRRDSNRCAYSGVELTNKTFSLDHVVPKSKGGKDSWENLVSCHKEINSRKGDRYNYEAGLHLSKRPVAPKSIPLCSLYPEIKHPDHQYF